MEFPLSKCMKRKENKKNTTEEKRRKKNESNHWEEKLKKKKNTRLLPVSLFTGAPHKYATSLSGNQSEEEVVFKRR